ncbi:hypothetical protein NPIL_149811, partial [Nephila pilipes]
TIIQRVTPELIHIFKKSYFIASSSTAIIFGNTSKRIAFSDEEHKGLNEANQIWSLTTRTRFFGLHLLPKLFPTADVVSCNKRHQQQPGDPCKERKENHVHPSSGIGKISVTCKKEFFVASCMGNPEI